MNDPFALLSALNLTVVRVGANGRYPRAEPGPAPGFRYWVNFVQGQYRFGVQAFPKRPLPQSAIDALERAGFLIMPARTEAFVWVGQSLEEAVDQARVTMVMIESILSTDKV